MHIDIVYLNLTWSNGFIITCYFLTTVNEFCTYYVCFRLKRDQQEFIDHRGLHVVVGHYLGDANSAGTSANLTDGNKQ